MKLQKNPEIHIKTDKQTIEESVEIIVKYLKEKGYMNVR